MTDLHIDDFYHDCAKILKILYKNFPRKTVLYVDDISGPDTPDEFGLHSVRHQSCFEAMQWLASMGYFNFEQSIRQEAVDQAVLTHKAFLLLNTALAATKIRTTREETLERQLLIHQLRWELKHGSSISRTEYMKQLMSLF